MHQSTNFQLVHISDDGEPRASTEAIALGYKATHSAVIKLARNYQTQIESFGQIRFESRLNKQGKATKYWLLNERQAAFLVGLMRNTKEVVDFKLSMSHEFWRMNDALQNRDLNLWERRLRLETNDHKSKELATIGSRLMIKRKQEKPRIEAERTLIDLEMNQPLWAN
jgi:phage regulator Rha-like protein